MRILTLFLDGIGLGADDPATNPFAAANTPTLIGLTGGRRWLAGAGKHASDRAVFVPTDALLDVDGYPQSGSGQASLLTGLNVPSLIGRHYGPKPDKQTREIITEHSYFRSLTKRGLRARLLTAYPPRLLADFERGKTLRSSIQQAAFESGQPHLTLSDLMQRRALTAEWTTDSWRRHLHFRNLPQYSPREAGRLLARLARKYDFAFHSHWLTDRIGHRGAVSDGVAVLERFDAVLAGVLEEWDGDSGLVVITSDHGNMEDLSTRRHTLNPVPTLIIGRRAAEFAEGYTCLADFVPACDRMLFDTR
ncbi:MAG: peptidase [Chloroflexi bacterium]|nr:peptidase [Chloroflexota bacterium]